MRIERELLILAGKIITVFGAVAISVALLFFLCVVGSLFAWAIKYGGPIEYSAERKNLDRTAQNL